MSVAAESLTSAEPVRLDYDDYVLYTEMHPDGDFELLNGVIYQLAPEGKSHKITRLRIDTYLHQNVALAKYTVGTEASFPAPGWKEGPKPDNFISLGALDMNDENPKEPSAEDMLLVIEITTSNKPDDNAELQRKRETYARVAIPDYWLIDLIGGSVIVHRDPNGDAEKPRYRSVMTFGRQETISALAVDNLSISTEILLKLAKAQ
jgi:Uma2 family endonuclease